MLNNDDDDTLKQHVSAKYNALSADDLAKREREAALSEDARVLLKTTIPNDHICGQVVQKDSTAAASAMSIFSLVTSAGNVAGDDSISYGSGGSEALVDGKALKEYC